ncbi:hypothetical protein LJC72_12585 [Bacteroides sp. OttesenSCG-928-D19]|nr:hypothetical protein [Bacteroides sp. OttesenSCG-928-D19]
MKQVLFIFLLSVFYSCTNNSKVVESKANDFSSVESDPAPIEVNNPWSNIDVIDLIKVKNDYKDRFTSGIENGSFKCKLYMTPYEGGYYGAYNLLSLGKKKESGLSAYTVIYNSEWPWMYDNNTDIFIEITIYNSDIFVFGEIEVGTNVSVLNKIFGNSLIKNHEFVIYKNKETNLLAVFRIKNDIIITILVGYYKDEVFFDLDKYFPVLIKGLNECDNWEDDY